MSTNEERREEHKHDAMLDAQDEEKRALWRYCAGTIGSRWWNRGKRDLCAKINTPNVLRGVTIRNRLLAAIDDVPDLDVLIRKTQPDMMAFEESRMTPVERYRF